MVRQRRESKREIVHEGPLQKHKRKQYQGFAKRWFILDSNGVLSYSVQPKAHIRDSVNLATASIARSKNSRSIHIDSDTATWHLKALTDEDFTHWTDVMRKFINVQEASDMGFGMPGVAGGAQKKPPQPEVNLSEVTDILAKMTSPLRDIEMCCNQAESSEASSGPVKPVQKVAKLFKRSNHDNTETSIDSEVEQLRKAHAKLFQQHRRLLELVSPSKGSGPLGAADGVASLDRSIIASRSAIGIVQPGEGGDSDEDDFQDAHDFDLDAIAIAAQSGNQSEAPSETESSQTDDDDDDSSNASDSSETSEGTAKGGGGDKDDGGEKDDGPEGKDETKRREQLPSKQSTDEGGVFGVLKNNIGKDLSKISFPVSFNEPIGALQKAAEELEHCKLLKKAASAKDIVDKLCYLGTFGISILAPTKKRSTKKPFNPLLGETYEYERPDYGFRFMSEKVSHHPPITAFHATGKNWVYTGQTSGGQKFWGRSLEYFPTGKSTFILGDGDDKEEFVWETRPNATVRGIMGGEKYIEYTGKLVIKHSGSDASVTVQFKEGSRFGGDSSRNKIEGKVKDDSGKEAATLEGRWDTSVSKKEGEDTYKELWRAPELPKDADKYFYFSAFTAQLNELTDGLEKQLPPTDTRLRPDQRAYEEGNQQEADQVKEKLEQKQRTRREKWEKGDQKPAPPLWFEKKGKDEYKYNDKYWDAREKGEWPEIKIYEQ